MPITEIIQGTDDDANDKAAELANDTLPSGEGEDTVEAGTGEDASGVEEQQESALVVTIGDAAPADEDENLNFKQLRERARDLAKENRELKRKQEATQGAVVETGLRAKPTIDGHAYDTDKYEQDLEKWFGEKAEHDAKAKTQAEAKRKGEEEWAQKEADYVKARDAFKVRVPDFGDAELAIEAALSKVQQGILLDATRDAPMMIWALHKNEGKLKELAAITNPVRFTAEVVRTEAQLKVSTRGERNAETMVSGTRATGKAGKDLMLDKLQAEAARTGDITKVVKYKREQRDKQRAA